MAASTTEGTGHGSAAKIKPLILNGDVKKTNFEPAILSEYDYDINTSGNITSGGHIRGASYGQILNTRFFDLANGNLTNSTTNYVDFANVSYTPVSDNSIILIEYDTSYTINGANGDEWRSSITVGATTITSRNQVWANANGGGTRSATIFPISMIFDNSALTNLSIKVSAARISGDDTLTVNTDNSFLRISEYAGD